jgi:hypothetical protein
MDVVCERQNGLVGELLAQAKLKLATKHMNSTQISTLLPQLSRFKPPNAAAQGSGDSHTPLGAPGQAVMPGFRHMPAMHWPGRQQLRQS